MNIESYLVKYDIASVFMSAVILLAGVLVGIFVESNPLTPWLQVTSAAGMAILVGYLMLMPLFLKSCNIGSSKADAVKFIVQCCQYTSIAVSFAVITLLAII